MRTFTTGAVAGMTDIPTKTLGRYVSDFRDLLSKAATQAQRGRRFTEKDVQIILTIRQGRAKGFPDHEIRKIVTDPSYANIEQELQFTNAQDLAANAYYMMQRADETLKDIERVKKQIILLFRGLRKNDKSLHDMYTEMNKRLVLVEIKNQSTKAPDQPKEKPPSSLGLLDKFGNWLDGLEE